MFPENHHVAVATGIASYWPPLVSNIDDFCCDHIFMSPGSCVATTISCRDLTVFPFIEFCVVTLFLL